MLLQKWTQQYCGMHLRQSLGMGCIWGSHWGRLISWNSIEKKKRIEEQEQLQGELIQKEFELKRRSGEKKLEKQIRLLQEQLRSFENQEMVWELKKLQHKFYEGVNKPGNIFCSFCKSSTKTHCAETHICWVCVTLTFLSQVWQSFCYVFTLCIVLLVSRFIIWLLPELSQFR